MRWIIGIITVFAVVLCWGNGNLAWAQEGGLSLEQGEAIATKAINAAERGNFAQAEQYWSDLIQAFPENPAVWSNRGNMRVSQNELQGAIADYNQAIKLAPDAPDPYLNRGIAYERQQQWSKAIADYEKVLSLTPQDPLAYNNLGNAQAGQGHWQAAIEDYKKATELAPDFAFAFANYALTLYQAEQQPEALRMMRNLVRKYPMFPDMRAALTAALWEQGQQGEAESNWVATVGMDQRYQDIEWVKTVRRWPPKMVAALEKFLNLD
ncbi:tetratricopeptide repeat protein [Spirulina subsalsa FACHB-351]|uniref:Tetratricopeptide repeat protein n=1 Tax=Spirulina subsalsa FACHB-351 TaxID=234711 RepID=A0ABT3L7B8_9CYAN|nr:tetratricopeptide repeat protein [Spirulina subsalsa]MCW6037403.1 tetratricopeptide repeat protein [Spirulina subsalsa FACHB-351]